MKLVGFHHPVPVGRSADRVITLVERFEPTEALPGRAAATFLQRLKSITFARSWG
jgi:hypothetical protein